MLLGGRGVSASPRGTPIFNPSDPNGFINADGWYDDPDDGERVRWWGGTSWTGFTQVGRVSKLRP